jgi:ribonucleoside-diphosphate reductase alpha chain
MLAHQMAAPNSPQWFNTGLHWAYGITGDAQGHFYYDEDAQGVAASSSAYERPQPHACFIQSCADDLVNPGGIMDLWTREARLFKYGSGTGTNFSYLRGRGELLSGGGRSSGLMSWLKIGDRAAAGIKSGGTTRRAAKMVVLDVDHPDVLDFISWKPKEQQKVAAMVVGARVNVLHLTSVMHAITESDLELPESADPSLNVDLAQAVLDARHAGVPDLYIEQTLGLARQGNTELDLDQFDLDWQGDAYNSVSGQQSNNSVRVTNAFMEAVQRGDDWDLIARTTGERIRSVPADEMWNRISQSAWTCGDPGLQFHTTANEWHTCPNDEPIRGTNPCGEYNFIDDTACNLASLNLCTFLSGRNFDVDAYQHAIELWTTVLEISVAMAQFPSEIIAKKSWMYRTLGLGYANVGALLMRLGLPYDSEGGRAVIGALTSMLSGYAYAQSAKMASVIGAFEAFERNREPMLRVVRNHSRAAAYDVRSYEDLSVPPVALQGENLPEDLAFLWEHAVECWEQACFLGEKHGYRNAQVTCIAPTGTIGLVMDCDTTGIEPDFSLIKFKKLAGGGFFQIINQSVPDALRNLGYGPGDVQGICTYATGTRELPAKLKSFLADKGFTDEMLASVESELPTAFNLQLAVSPYVIGLDACANRLGFSKDELSTPGFSLLGSLGLDSKQISELSLTICGHRTLNGSGLDDEHLPVFHCAGDISAEGHIRMVAASQSFVSGAISKTINLPRHATIADVADAYMLSWRLGLKANALYRDGSKLSQPLSASLVDNLFGGLEEVVRAYDLPSEPTQEEVMHVAEKLVVRYLSKRRKLPFKRKGYTQKVVINGQKLFLHVGEYEDGGLGEIFVDMSKEGAALGGLLNSFCMAVSMGLQHGVPLERFVELFTFQTFSPNGMVQGDDRVMNCTSIIDYVFRHLAVNYLDRDDLAHTERPTAVEQEAPEWSDEEVVGHNPLRLRPIDVDEVPAGVIQASVSVKSVEARISAPMSAMEVARAGGYEGECCDECGQAMMVRNGSCLKCTACGATTGCS